MVNIHERNGVNMALKLDGYAGNGTFPHGIHPPDRKQFSKDAAIQVMPTPKTVVLSLHQNIGGPCEQLVKPRQTVAWGELIGKGKIFVSTTLHASVPGVVQRPTRVTLANGRHMDTVPIKTDGEIPTGQALWDEIFGGDWPTTGLDAYDPQEISTAINDAGLVGLGGAAFPTHVKIMPNDKKPVHTLIINGCECEPYLTSDYRLMVEAPGPIVTGALLAARSVGAERIAIGIEDNKMDAVEAMRQAARGTGIQVAVLKTKYPQGSEKHLIQAVVKRQVPLGGAALGRGRGHQQRGYRGCRGAGRGPPETLDAPGDQRDRGRHCPAVQCAGADRGLLRRPDRVLRRPETRCGPPGGRRPHDGLCLFQSRHAGDQGHQRSDRHVPG